MANHSKIMGQPRQVTRTGTDTEVHKSYPTNAELMAKLDELLLLVNETLKEVDSISDRLNALDAGDNKPEWPLAQRADTRPEQIAILKLGDQL